MTTLAGQTVVVLGGGAGIGLETARLARAKGAELILTTRDPDHLFEAGRELGARIATVDVGDFERLAQFFAALPGPVDHIFLTGTGTWCASLGAQPDLAAARRTLDAHLMLPLHVARHAMGRVRAGGTVLFVGSVGGLRVAPGLALIAAVTAALPVLTRDLALALAPVRVNLIAAGLVDVAAPPGPLGGARRTP